MFTHQLVLRHLASPSLSLDGVIPVRFATDVEATMAGYNSGDYIAAMLDLGHLPSFERDGRVVDLASGTELGRLVEVECPLCHARSFEVMAVSPDGVLESLWCERCESFFGSAYALQEAQL